MTLEFEITKETIIADVLRVCPECIEVFDKYGMPCRTCMGASTGTVYEGSIMHDVDVDVIIRELQQCCSSSRLKAEQGTQP